MFKSGEKAPDCDWKGVNILSCQGFIKGMAAGMVIGACAAMVVDPVSDRQHRKMQKKTEGMFKNIGNIIDTAMDMIR